MCLCVDFCQQSRFVRRSRICWHTNANTSENTSVSCTCDISAFFKQCPKYTPLEQINITLPTVSDMLKVQYFQDTIFDALYHQLDIVQYNKYIKRMFSNYLYVTHKGKIYQIMLKPQSETTEPCSLICPMAIKADFLCVFRNIDILNID